MILNTFGCITLLKIIGACMLACVFYRLMIRPLIGSAFKIIVVVTVHIAGLYSQLGKVVGTPVAEQ